MGLKEIQDLYDNLYASKYNELVKKKQQSLADLDTQETTTNNQYTDVVNNLNQKKTDTGNKYKQLYTGLDTKQAEGKQQYYGERNNVAYNAAQKAQQIRDWMAKNNLLQSGESVDAQLRNNTDYSNNMGTVMTNETNFNRDILNNRNQYSAEEQGIYNDIGNQISSADREKAQKITDITNRRGSINTGFEGDNNALKSEIEAQRIKDVNTYNAEQERIALEEKRIKEQREYEAQKLKEQRDYEAKQQEIAYQRQLALQRASASSRSSSSGGSRKSSSSNSSNSTSQKQMVQYAWQDFQQALSKGDTYWLGENRDALIESIGQNEWNKMYETQKQKEVEYYKNAGYMMDGEL